MNEMNKIIELLDAIREARKVKDFKTECSCVMELEDMGFTLKMILERI